MNPYTREFALVGGVWPHLRRSPAELTGRGLDQLTAPVRTRRPRNAVPPRFIDGLLAKTRLGLPVTVTWAMEVH
ncbi:hypothetical protein CTU88_38650 [Streptomyces sp. JV178]|nr:hypothetical protein CTU88_38650 [Streptomyces sp. JV178]